MDGNPRLVMVATAVLGCVASCAYTVPYRSSGPALSKEGVQVNVAGERCYVNRSGEQYPTGVDDDRLNLEVEVQVKNPSSQVAVVSLDHFSLCENLGGQCTMMRPLEAGALSLDPGQAKTVALDFEQEGELDCHHEMELRPAGAITIEGRQVHLEPIRFLVSR